MIYDYLIGRIGRKFTDMNGRFFISLEAGGVGYRVSRMKGTLTLCKWESDYTKVVDLSKFYQGE